MQSEEAPGRDLRGRGTARTDPRVAGPEDDVGDLPKAWWLGADIQLWTGAGGAWLGEGSSPALRSALETGFRAGLETVNMGQGAEKEFVAP